MKFEDEFLVLATSAEEYDADGYPIEPQSQWVSFGKCFLSFNSVAQKIRLADGSDYSYSYYIIAPLTSDTYSLIPKEGERVRIVKADGTVDKIMEVRGFVTYKKRYLKVWL